MKKLLSIAITALFVFGAYAENGEEKEVKVTNYKEVISSIEYPQSCREKGIEGKVIVQILVDEFGTIKGEEFVAYPCVELRDAVKSSISKLQFSPARNEKGEAINGVFTLPVNFKLTL